MFSLGFSTERTHEINKPCSEVFSHLADFSNWPAWSPWLCQEPDCPVTISGTLGVIGYSQKWEGRAIGEGCIELMSFEQDLSLDYELKTIKPWKSKSGVSFKLKETKNGCKVSWSMKGSVPFFLFFMRRMMSSLIGCDYDRGLSMLTDILEQGEILSASEDEGKVIQEPFYLVGVRTTCNIKDIESAMENDFCTLEKALDDNSLPQSKSLGSVYEKYDMVKGTVRYVSGVIYSSITQPPDGFVVVSAPQHTALRVDHKGAYKHLGNSWAKAMGLQRYLKLKCHKGIAPYEIYRTDPKEHADRDLVTEIYVPIR
ncbi:MAG: SRPBCC family protein [Planctomycetes bacterium]|nr:SRPBCC family protein [Planctomycetota bacterium]